MSRYYQDCPHCEGKSYIKEEESGASYDCSHCSFGKVEADTLPKKLAAIEALTVDVLAELETMDLPKDRRSARYSELGSQLLAAQVLANVRILIDKHKEKN